MRTRILIDEDLWDVGADIAEARKYLGIFGVTVDAVKGKVDTLNPKNYDVISTDGVPKKSLGTQYIYDLHGDKTYDCYGVITDRTKTDAQMGLYGQQASMRNGHQVIEVYAVKNKKGTQGLSFLAYSIVHEVMHALADFHKVEDTLHADLKRMTLDEYREVLLDRILHMKNTWGLLPEVGRKIWEVMHYASGLGTPIKILEGYRSPERQDALYKQKPKVTNAKAWQSMHQYRIAFDYCFDGKVPFPPSGDPKWNAVNSFAKKIGLYSYGIDESFDDGHLELLFGNTEKQVMARSIDWTPYWKAPVRPKFDRDLMKGSKGEDVRSLQVWLNQSGFTVAKEGPGSPGNETDFFGEMTRSAVGRWQKENGISPAEGYFGPISRMRF